MAADATARARRELIDYACGFPETTLEHPWDEDVVKVRGRIFVFFGMPGQGLGIGVKLPESSDFALMQPGVTPSGYNLGRAGWVSARYEPGEEPPVDILRQWIDESYRAVAPKELVKVLDQTAAKPAPRRIRYRKRRR